MMQTRRDILQFFLSHDGSRLYAANEDAGTAAITSNNVSVIDATTPKLVATIPAGARAWGVAIGR